MTATATTSLPPAASNAAGAPAASARFTPERVQTSLRARFNPIRHLTPEFLARTLDLFHAGYLRQTALLWDAMERRDDVLQGVAAKRKKAVARLQWEILTTDDSPIAARHRAALEYFYNNLTATHACDPQERGGLGLLVKQMLDAVGKKYAVHEIVWERRPAPTGQMAPGATQDADDDNGEGEDTTPDGDESAGANQATGASANAAVLPRTVLTATFRFAPLWFFEARTGSLRFLPEDFAVEGVDLTPGQWLVTVGEGLMESCSIAYLFKHLPLRDWLVYCERNGMPGVRGVTDAAPGTIEWEAARDAVRDFGAEFHALMSRGTEIDPIDLSTRGELPYPALVERMDRAMATLWRGADLSTLSRGAASGASLQADETELIEHDDATLVSETLNTQVDRVVIRESFGDETPRAYFRLSPRQETARRAYLDLVERLVRLGVPVSLGGLHERLGMPRPAAGEATIGPVPRAPAV